jgi:hypothetical protein
MDASPLMSAAESRNLLSLSVASTTVDPVAASGGVGLVLQAKQLNDVRAHLRDGETYSVSA